MTTFSRRQKQTEAATNFASQLPALMQSDALKLQRQLETFKKTMENNVKDLFDLDLARDCAAQSLALANKLRKYIVRDVNTAHRTNLEGGMWKACVYGTIETFRSAVLSSAQQTRDGSSGGKQQSLDKIESGKELKRILLDFIEQTLRFYTSMLTEYEQKYELIFVATMPWHGQPPPLFLVECILLDQIEYKMKALCDSNMKRLMLACGDLCRYRAHLLQHQASPSHESNSSKTATFALARVHYWSAAQLDASNGRVWNQLGVLAQQSHRWLDTVFYYLRALSVNYPFSVARESVESALQGLKRQALFFEGQIRDEIDKRKKDLGGCANLPNSFASEDDGYSADVDTTWGGGFSAAYVRDDEGSDELARRRRALREVWIRPEDDGKVKVEKSKQQPVKGKDNEMLQRNAEEIAQQQIICKMLFSEDREKSKHNQKNSLVHVLYTAGLLVRGIDTESFSRSFYSLAIEELIAFVLADDNGVEGGAMLSSLEIVQLLFPFLFAAHYVRKGASSVLISDQQKLAFDALLALFARLVNALNEQLQAIGLFLLTGQPSKKLENILPLLSLLSVWLLHLGPFNLVPLLRQRSSSLTEDKRGTHHYSSIWIVLAALANGLQELANNGQLAPVSLPLNFAECNTGSKNEDANKDNQGPWDNIVKEPCDGEPAMKDDGLEKVLLPEILLISPLFEVFPREPVPILVNTVALPSNEQETTNKTALALHTRLGLLLAAAHQLATFGHDNEEGVQNLLFRYDAVANRFFGRQIPVIIVGTRGGRPVCSSSSSSTCSVVPLFKGGAGAEQNANTESGVVEFEGRVCEDEVFAEEDDEAIKQRLRDEEARAGECLRVMEVRPHYVVLDTNALVQHLGRAQSLIRSRLFAVFVPTIVVDEVRQLALGAPVPRQSMLRRDQLLPIGHRLQLLQKRAQKADRFLKKVAEQRWPGIDTVTTNGELLPKGMFVAEDSGGKKTNDDRILETARNLCLKKPGNHGDVNEMATTLKRSVVLITGDRGLAVKAIAEKIPVRTLVEFTVWARIPIDDNTVDDDSTAEDSASDK